jgi:hypothetical protein
VLLVGSVVVLSGGTTVPRRTWTGLGAGLEGPGPGRVEEEAVPLDSEQARLADSLSRLS